MSKDSKEGQSSVTYGALLTVAMRWIDRLIGLVSTLILARLLVPADFGIIAMASLVIGLADVLLDLGVNVALIQNKKATQAHYNTAWTLRLVQTLVATGIVAIIAPLASAYFKEPRVAPVIQVLALSFILSGAENIGIIAFQKEMQFSQDFRFILSKRITGFTVTMIAAWLMQSYWALVIGSLAGRIFGVILSYAMHPMRPRPSFEKFREIFAVSQWMLIRSISGYLDNNLHQMIVGRREDASIMGAYSLASEISALPTTELLAPLNRVLFPAFVKVSHNLTELKRIFLLAQGVQTLIGIPAGVGLALVANEAVLLLLGEKWHSAVPLVQIIALVNVMTAIMTSGGYILITLGKIRTIVIYSWIQVGMFATLAFLSIPHGGALQIAWLRLIVAVVGIVVFIWLLLRELKGLRLIEIFASVTRPLIGASIMAFSVVNITSIFDLQGKSLLVTQICVGAVSYSLSIMVLWRLAGCPSGAESYLFEKVAEYRKSGAKHQ
ncbi:MAG TPA: lipopolysaccharide biosynthesis protein [Candidatus Competibacteraceae bacterium]|nr:lipopolysaccharide biosynthesis protein [Candidatus Competibacter sp.]MDG4606911.1 lipopolysaccharide biosynthesis protein [Candidatus Contendobacter sp.]HRD49367.1 lipopolysaccharide biosynthesis protein [Candidatus Contendobacter sp.]HRF45422.1 lipopolysaccharide biosynthesis protein [Candidatus Competibacteraceae bacterium]